MPEGAQPVGTEGPGRRLTGDAPAAAQHVAGDGEFVGRGADVGAGVVQHEIFKVHELAVEPQRGAGVGKILALKQAGADRRTGDALVEPGCRFYFPISTPKKQCAPWIYALRWPRIFTNNFIDRLPCQTDCTPERPVFPHLAATKPGWARAASRANLTEFSMVTARAGLPSSARRQNCVCRPARSTIC